MKTIIRHLFFFTFFIMLILVGRDDLYAQASTFPLEGFIGNPRIYKIDVRSTSLGEAGIADPGHFASFSNNPALLSFSSDQLSINMSGYQNLENNLLQYTLTPPAFSSNKHTGIFRLGYFHTGLGEINPIENSSLAEPNLKMYQVDGAYSLAINSLFSFGILQTVSFSTNDNAQYWTYSANSGLFYNPVGPISYGLVVRGLGRSAQYRFIEDGTTILGSHNIPISLDIGATLRFPTNDKEPVFSISLSNEKRFQESGIWYKGGIEVMPSSFLALRGGILFHPENEIYVPRFGIGLNTNRLKLNYGASPRVYKHERFHQLGLTLHF